MAIARINPEIKCKNYPEIWGEVLTPELELVWLGRKTAAEALKAAKAKLDQLKLVQGNY